jgi:hypothetical protein
MARCKEIPLNFKNKRRHGEKQETLVVQEGTKTNVKKEKCGVEIRKSNSNRLSKSP